MLQITLLPHWGLPSRRVIVGTAYYLAQIIGSLCFAAGYTAGLLAASIAMVLSFASLISGAWLLIVGIHQGQGELQ